jgi:hypothetical protein
MGTMVSRTTIEDPEIKPSECWCCGSTDDPVQMVHLGNHPEVALCRRCAHWASKQAWQIADRAKTGPLVFARERLRALRRAVVERGWQHLPVFGGPMRWIGERLA